MILNKFRIDGQVAVITGGTRGIGRAITLALAEAGADIGVVSRKPSLSLEETVKRMGRRYCYLSADLTRRDQTRSVIPYLVGALGGVNILVNNAGIIRKASAADFSESDWDATLEIHLNAAFILSQAAGRIMLEKGKGKIINVASVMAFQGGLNVAYTSAKHGIAGLTKALANDWAAKGVNVNGLAPSFFATELTDAFRNDPQRSKWVTDRTPIGRWGKPEDIAGAVLFLASSASDFIHGVILPVDGGWMAW